MLRATYSLRRCSRAGTISIRAILSHTSLLHIFVIRNLLHNSILLVGMYLIPKKPDNWIARYRIFGFLKKSDTGYPAGYSKLNFFVNITIIIYLSIMLFTFVFNFPQLISQYCNRNLLLEYLIYQVYPAPNILPA